MSTKSQIAAPRAEIPSSNAKVPAVPPANAWSRPLQSKRPVGPPPGIGPPNPNSAITASASSLMVQNRERLLHLSLTLIGHKVVVEQVDGAIVEGIFHTFTPFNHLSAENKNKYVLKEIRVHRPPSTNNGSNPVLKDGATLMISASKVVYLHAKNVDLDRPDRGHASNKLNGSGGVVSSPLSSGDTFATDTQISGGKGGKDKGLVAAGSAWTSSSTDGGIVGNFRGQAVNAPLQTNSRAAALGGPKTNNKGPGGTNTAGKLSGSIGGWDQFKANEELFNVNASFDENIYTTQLNLDSIDATRMAEAERIAREIETSVTENAHMAEERGQKIENDFRDEEDKYSTVLTEDLKQRHEVKAQGAGVSKTSQASAVVPKVPSSTSSGQKKVMNYAAAAAKAEPMKKTAPVGAVGSTTLSPPYKDDQVDDVVASSSPTAVTPDAKVNAEIQKLDETKMSEPSKAEPSEETESAHKLSPEEKNDDSTEDIKATQEVSKDSELKAEEKIDSKEVVKTSKLNANAKAFTFNPQAKSFTPTMGGAAYSNGPTTAQLPQQHMATDPSMQMFGGLPMQPTHYIPHMGQPGMMPIMTPQYGGMSYPPQYGRDQHMLPMHHRQGAPVQGSMPPTSTSTNGNVQHSVGSPPTPTNDDDSTPTHDDSSQPSAGAQQQQRAQQHDHGQPQQQQIPMPYGVPPGAYFPGTIGMPRPGFPQFVTGPQMPGRPVPPFGVFPMQPGGIPPNMQMRGPNGAPYYPGPNGPMPYPPGTYMGHGMMDDGGGGGDPNYRGRGGRGPGGGRGRGGRGRGGRSRGRGYNNHHPNSGGNNSGRNTPQQTQQPQSVPQQQDQSSTENVFPSIQTVDNTANRSEEETND